MKVKDFILKLQELPQDLEVVEKYQETGDILSIPDFVQGQLFLYKRTKTPAAFYEEGKSSNYSEAVDYDNPIPAVEIFWGEDL
jgi:hypothetical protein